VLAVLDEQPHVAKLAEELAVAERARLTIIQTWRIPALLWAGIYFASCSLSAAEVRSDSEQNASQRVRGLIGDLGCPVTFSCLEGYPWSIAAREAGSGLYSVVFIDRRWLRLAQLLTRMETDIYVGVPSAPMIVGCGFGRGQSRDRAAAGWGR
jgi:hypothetical protein